MSFSLVGGSCKEKVMGSLSGTRADFLLEADPDVLMERPDLGFRAIKTRGGTRIELAPRVGDRGGEFRLEVSQGSERVRSSLTGSDVEAGGRALGVGAVAAIGSGFVPRPLPAEETEVAVNRVAALCEESFGPRPYWVALVGDEALARMAEVVVEMAKDALPTIPPNAWAGVKFSWKHKAGLEVLVQACDRFSGRFHPRGIKKTPNLREVTEWRDEICAHIGLLFAGQMKDRLEHRRHMTSGPVKDYLLPRQQVGRSSRQETSFLSYTLSHPHGGSVPWR